MAFEVGELVLLFWEGTSGDERESIGWVVHDSATAVILCPQKVRYRGLAPEEYVTDYGRMVVRKSVLKGHLTVTLHGTETCVTGPTTSISSTPIEIGSEA